MTLPEIREIPLSQADNVMAIYTFGLPTEQFGELICLIASDGLAIWSTDRISGGPPYFEAYVDPLRVHATLDRLRHDGLFHRLPTFNYGILDSSWVIISVCHKSEQFKLESAHELFEFRGAAIAESTGVRPLRKRPPRLQVLPEQSQEWLYTRLVWQELRSAFDQLLPREGTAVEGHLEFAADGREFWVYNPKKD